MALQVSSLKSDSPTVISLDEWLAKHRPEIGPVNADGGLLMVMRGLEYPRACALANEALGYDH